MPYNIRKNGIALHFASTLALLSLMSCAGVTYTTPEQVAQDTRVNTDPYTQTTWITSPFIKYDGGLVNVCLLRSAIIDGSFAFYQLVVNVVSSEWLFLSSANDIQGTTLEVVVIDQEIKSGYIEETVGLSLTEAYMGQASLNGLNIRIRGRRGSTTVKLPGLYVLGHLQKVRSYMIDNGLVSESAMNQLSLDIIQNSSRIEKAVKDRGKIGATIAFKRVLTVVPGSPAEIGGIRVGDIILSVDGQLLTGDTLHDGLLVTGEPGSIAELLILRGEERRVLKVTRGKP